MARKELQLIPDADFARGFTVVSQKDHANGEAYSPLGQFVWSEDTPLWKVAQWDSGPCLWQNRVASDARTLTDGHHRRVSFNEADRSLEMLLDSSLYYQGKGAVAGDYWPHLLIEQYDFGYDTARAQDRMFYRCDSDLHLSFEVRFPAYSHTPCPDDWVAAAQCLMYLYVKGKETGDFVWFGQALFDNRTPVTQLYTAYDGGKPDASSALIYLIGSCDTFRNSPRDFYRDGHPDPSSAWIPVEIDLGPHLRHMFECGKSDGYLRAQSLSELVIDGMNFGWEIIGTFRAQVDIRNLRLVSRR